MSKAFEDDHKSILNIFMYLIYNCYHHQYNCSLILTRRADYLDELEKEKKLIAMSIRRNRMLIDLLSSKRYPCLKVIIKYFVGLHVYIFYF